ncbi:MAG TPA: Atu4866 domain-containing protein [Actinoplanes sp.]|nr:Atu4866 domain-containing protein [Actinoplanes sp.]
MRIHCGPGVDTTILGAATLLALAMGNGSAPSEFELVHPPAVVAADADAAGYLGLWLSPDRTVRLALEPDGRYERSVAGRKKVAHGTYRVAGTTVLLRDDSGLRTTVIFFDGALEMAGHRLFRE